MQACFVARDSEPTAFFQRTQAPPKVQPAPAAKVNTAKATKVAKGSKADKGKRTFLESVERDGTVFSVGDNAYVVFKPEELPEEVQNGLPSCILRIIPLPILGL